MSKILFLTSSPYTVRGFPFSTENEFTSRMQKAVEQYNKALFITASPDNAERTDDFAFGISAGSMNSATEVYAQPELEGESVDPDYVKFFPGLGLTETQLLPHYQDIKDDFLDGKRLFEDITYADSIGHKFIAIPDGSYLYSEDGKEEIMGNYYVISDGAIKEIN